MMLGLVLWTIAGVLIVAFIAAVSMLCIPMRISIIFDAQRQPAFFFKVFLLDGLLPVISRTEQRRKKNAKKRAKTGSSKSRAPRRQDVAAFAPHMLRELPNFVSKVVRRVKLEKVDANFRFGLLDPADTGIVYGALIPLLQLFGASKRSNIVLNPDFSQEVFDGRGHIGARFLPIALIAPILGFAWVTMVLPRLSRVFR